MLVAAGGNKGCNCVQKIVLILSTAVLYTTALCVEFPLLCVVNSKVFLHLLVLNSKRVTCSLSWTTVLLYSSYCTVVLHANAAYTMQSNGMSIITKSSQLLML